MSRKGDPGASKRIADTSDPAVWILDGALFVACSLPLVVAYQLPPQPTFVNQWLAGVLWSIVLACFVLRTRNAQGGSPTIASRTAIGFWLTLLFGIVVSALSAKTPLSIAVPSAIAVVAIAALTWLATRLDEDAGARAFRAICLGLVVAAAVNSAVAALQFVAPLWHDDRWIAALQGDRVYGNLRQPNLLALVCLLGLIGAGCLFKQTRWLWVSATVLFSWSVFASGSRAGMLAWLVLVLGYMAGRSSFRATTSMRRLTVVTALACVVTIVMALAAYQTGSDIRAASAQHRLLLWQNVATLISHAPATGVGFGQLNFAWTLTPLAERAPDVFDHAHNFALHWAVELGIPLALLLCTLLAAALISVALKSDAKWKHGALAMISVALIHSLVEFPLWFLHLLLPLAMVLALAAATRKVTSAHAPAKPRPRAKAVPYAIAAAIFGASITAAAWYWRGAWQLTEIYAHAGDPVRAAETASQASRHAVLGHYGDYAQIMLAGDDATLSMFTRPTRVLIDERLLLAWARAHERAGDSARASYLLDRAREFPSLRTAIDQASQPQNAPVPRAASQPLTAREFR